jgi:hypothetical protein
MVIKIPLSKLKIPAIQKLENRMKKLRLAERTVIAGLSAQTKK